MKTLTWMLLCVALLTNSAPSQGKEVQEMDTLTIWVNGLCGMCKNRIENAALRTRGVEEATWESEGRMLTITFESRQVQSK